MIEFSFKRAAAPKDNAFHYFSNLPSPCEDRATKRKCEHYTACASGMSCLNFVIFVATGRVNFSKSWPSVEMHELCEAAEANDGHATISRARRLHAEQQDARHAADMLTLAALAALEEQA